MATSKWEQLVAQLNHKNDVNPIFKTSKIGILMSLRSCISNGPLPEQDELILKVMPTLNEIITTENIDLFTRQHAAYLVTDIGNDYNLGLLYQIPRETVKALATLLSNYKEIVLELQQPIITLLASLCNCDEKDNKQKIIITKYRKAILYETESVKHLSQIINHLIGKLLSEENFIDRYAMYNQLLISALRSCVYAMICFIPRGSILIKETDWYQQYGEYIINTFCQCTEITDRSVLGDVCDGLSTIYILSSNNHKAGAICAKMLKSLYNNGEYYMVKKAAKQAVMSIVVEFFIRQAGCGKRCPSEIVFTLVKYTGNMDL